MNERMGTDFFPMPYKKGVKYYFMRKDYKVNLVWNYTARLYAEPYEKDSNNNLVSCSGKYEVSEFKRLFHAHKIQLVYDDYDKKTDDDLTEFSF